jgi:hypothetical protein
MVHDNSDEEDLFDISFLGHHYWELNHRGKTLMRVRYGVPELPRTPFDEKKFRLDVRRIFKSTTDRDLDRLTELVRTAEHEAHGTLLIITEAAESEAGRLSGQGTPIEPCLLTPELLGVLTPIDGAILLTPVGICHGIATILDGRATRAGDPGRGARFNSAVRYVESEWPCIAIVVSEDGGIDFVPDLRPPVRRAVIDRVIVELESLNEQAPVDSRRYHAAVDILERHRFYLRRADCDLINPIVEHLEAVLREQENEQMWIVRPEFVPNLQLDEQLYYEPEQ